MAEYLIAGDDFLNDQESGAEYLLPASGEIAELPAAATAVQQPVVVVIT